MTLSLAPFNRYQVIAGGAGAEGRPLSHPCLSSFRDKSCQEHTLLWVPSDTSPVQPGHRATLFLSPPFASASPALLRPQPFSLPFLGLQIYSIHSQPLLSYQITAQFSSRHPYPALDCLSSHNACPQVPHRQGQRGVTNLTSVPSLPVFCQGQSCQEYMWIPPTYALNIHTPLSNSDFLVGANSSLLCIPEIGHS